MKRPSGDQSESCCELPLSVRRSSWPVPSTFLMKMFGGAFRRYATRCPSGDQIALLALFRVRRVVTPRSGSISQMSARLVASVRVTAIRIPLGEIRTTGPP
jgi:hypothetical protein